MSNEIKSDLNTNETTQSYENSDNNTESQQSQQQSPQSQLEELGDFILDTRNLDHQEINKTRFKKGIDEYSVIAGKMAVITSMGIESKVALEFVERELIRVHESKLLKQRQIEESITEE